MIWIENHTKIQYIYIITKWIGQEFDKELCIDLLVQILFLLRLIKFYMDSKKLFVDKLNTDFITSNYGNQFIQPANNEKNQSKNFKMVLDIKLLKHGLVKYQSLWEFIQQTS